MIFFICNCMMSTSRYNDNESDSYGENINNWKKDCEDKRDYVYVPKFNHSKLPWKVDFRKSYDIIDVDEQDDIKLSVIYSVCFCYYIDQLTNKKNEFVPSKLFLYYNLSNNDKNKKQKNYSIREVLKNINNFGVCKEKTWMSNIKPTLKPVRSAYSEANKYKNIIYNHVNHSLKDIKTALANNFPVIFGMNIYSSFMSESLSKTGNMFTPNNSEKKQGSQIMVLVGYDEYRRAPDGSLGAFIVRNSWGKKWGENGYFYAPYSVIKDQDICSDFWIMTKKTFPDNAKVNLLTQEKFVDKIDTVRVQVPLKHTDITSSTQITIPVNIPVKNKKDSISQIFNIELIFLDTKNTKSVVNDKNIKKNNKKINHVKMIGFKKPEKSFNKNETVKKNINISIRKKKTRLHLV